MRNFSNNINNKGVIVQQKSIIRNTGYTTIYTKPNPAITKLDLLRNGHSPKIYLSRKNGGIGDILMTTPLVRELANKYNIKITYGVDYGYLDGSLEKTLRYNPYIDKIVPWKEVEENEFDVVVDLTCPCVAHEQPKAPPVNRIDLFARYVHVKLTDTSLIYVLQDEEIEWARNYITNKNLDKYRQLVLVQPSSSAIHRDLPADKLKYLIVKSVQQKRNVGYLVITHESDNKKDINWNDINNVHILKNLDIRQLAAIMKCCNMVLCPDSSILHLASALHMKTLTIFGPTDPYARVNYHPEAVAYWPGKELSNYPIWYSPSVDNYICWKRAEVDILSKILLAMINDQPLPICRDIVTFGNFQTENQYYEIL